MKKLIHLALITCMLFAGSAIAASKGKIVRWVDKNGKVHYGDKPPMPSDSRKASVLNKDGVKVEQIDYDQHDDVTLDKVDAEQARKDAALLGSYSSAEDIDVAKERNTKIDKNALKLLNRQRDEQKAALAKQEKEMETYIAAGKPVPKNLFAKTQKNKAAIAKTDEMIAKKEEAIKKTEQRYENDKTRYLSLKPNKGKLQDIRHKQNEIAELERWKRQAEARLKNYESEALRYKRSGQPVPGRVKSGLLSATQEMERASQQILAAEEAIKENKRAFSQGK